MDLELKNVLAEGLAGPVKRKIKGFNRIFSRYTYFSVSDFVPEELNRVSDEIESWLNEFIFKPETIEISKYDHEYEKVVHVQAIYGDNIIETHNS